MGLRRNMSGGPSQLSQVYKGFQYGYAARKTWADPNVLAPQGLDNMVWTFFRYYQP